MTLHNLTCSQCNKSFSTQKPSEEEKKEGVCYRTCPNPLCYAIIQGTKYSIAMELDSNAQAWDE